MTNRVAEFDLLGVLPTFSVHSSRIAPSFRSVFPIGCARKPPPDQKMDFAKRETVAAETNPARTNQLRSLVERTILLLFKHKAILIGIKSTLHLALLVSIFIEKGTILVTAWISEKYTRHKIFGVPHIKLPVPQRYHVFVNREGIGYRVSSIEYRGLRFTSWSPMYLGVQVTGSPVMPLFWKTMNERD